jgi:hypothetical protein
MYLNDKTMSKTDFTPEAHEVLTKFLSTYHRIAKILVIPKVI